MNVEYYIQEIDATLNPSVDNQVRPIIQVQLTPGEPQLNKENERLTSTFRLNLSFIDRDRDQPDDDEAEPPSEPEYGEVTVEFLVAVEDELEYLSEQASIWKDEDYDRIDERLIAMIEEDIMPRIFVPIDSMVGNSIKGVIPRFRFTASPDDHSSAADDEETDEQT